MINRIIAGTTSARDIFVYLERDSMSVLFGVVYCFNKCSDCWKIYGEKVVVLSDL